MNSNCALGDELSALEQPHPLALARRRGARGQRVPLTDQRLDHLGPRGLEAARGAVHRRPARGEALVRALPAAAAATARCLLDRVDVYCRHRDPGRRRGVRPTRKLN